MKYTVAIDQQAKREIDEVRRFIEAEGYPLGAHRWAEGLHECLATLRFYPEACSLARENDDYPGELRQLSYKSYRVIFTIQGSTVRILHVRHAARRDLTDEA